jgi:hypothetical protein
MSVASHLSRPESTGLYVGAIMQYVLTLSLLSNTPFTNL